MLLLGYDIGSSSVKATLLDAESGKVKSSAFHPKKEMEMISLQPGWAEQNPETWWENLRLATREMLSRASVKAEDIKAIGISYQMHGLVVVDKNKKVLRNSIIWCDSRAVETGNRAFEKLGKEKCLDHFLNSPGNFTASKLKWVKENEPNIYSQIHKIMLPGDYIAMKLTGEIRTTASGLSEGILWDYKEESPAGLLLDHFGIDKSLLPERAETFSVQGKLTAEAASELGLKEGTLISYRAGDQPNNAFSLNVLNPGEVAATAGTSGVIYGVSDKAQYDKKSRVNTFMHVTHKASDKRFGVLLCVNGTGILNNWLKNSLLGMAPGLTYPAMNELAEKIAPGSEGLCVLPFGNGAERILENKDTGAHFMNMRFNNHTAGHVLRAAQEGIVFSLKYGLDIMEGTGVKAGTIRAGHANMFLSPVFSKAFSTITGAVTELYDTDGSQGAARGAGYGAGVYQDLKQAFHGLTAIKTIEPDQKQKEEYQLAYEFWLANLKKITGE